MTVRQPQHRSQLQGLKLQSILHDDVYLIIIIAGTSISQLNDVTGRRPILNRAVESLFPSRQMSSISSHQAAHHIHCPFQLCEEAIIAFEPALPPLQESLVTPAILEIAAQLRARFSDASSNVKVLMRTMRSAWISWHSLPVLTADISAASAPRDAGYAVDAVTSDIPATLNCCRLRIAQLQDELQDAIRRFDQSCAKNDQLKEQLHALFRQQPHDSAFSTCYSGVINGNKRLDEHFLRDIFDRHKSAGGGLCGPSLAQALRDANAPIVPDSDQALADIIIEFDVNGNGNLGFGEFRQAANAPDELQLWFNENHIPLAANALRPLVGRGSDQLKQFGQLSSDALQHSAAAIASAIPMILQGLHQQIQHSFAVQLSIESEMKADPSKFNDFYKMACGSVADFHTGLTGRVGMPHLNFKNAMRQEHCERAGCDVAFTTGNYKITTTPATEWRCVVDNAACSDMGHNRRLLPIHELLQMQVSIDAKLCEEEVIAIVLYTGPMFQVYNTILRQYPLDSFEVFKNGGNLFPTTIFVLVSAVQKLCRYTRIPEGTLLYRGLGGKADLPDIFFLVDKQGCSGYAEWGFLSTTSDRDVALGYSGVRERRSKAMVMVIETSAIDRGADISEFSQYPGEREFLYLPCSFIQRTRRGNRRVQVVDGGLVTFVSVKVNLNIKTQTVEELREQKKSLHLVSARSILSEVHFELTEWAESAPLQGIDLSRLVGDVPKFISDTMAAFREVVFQHERCEAGDYANDETFRRMVNGILDAKADAIGAKNWQQTRLQLSSHDFESAAVYATLQGHRSDIFSLAFHPTAPILATGSDDKTAKLWRLTSDNSVAACCATLQGHSDRLRCVAFHPTADVLATGSDDKSVKLWRLTPDHLGAACCATLQGHTGTVFSVGFHPSAPILATGSADKNAKLWRLATDNSSAVCCATLIGHRNDILSVVFCPTAPVLATGSQDSTIKLWSLPADYSAASCVSTLQGHGDGVRSLAFHPSACILASGSSDETVKLWLLSPDHSAASCCATLKGHSDSVWSVAFHPTANILATGSSDESAKLWRLTSDNSDASCLSTLQADSWVFVVAFHPTAPILAIGGEDNAVKLWR